MKKALIIMVLCISVFFTACGSKSAIQEATGADSKQNVVITETLEAAGINYELINEAKNNMPDISLQEGHKIYNVIDKEAANYFLILDADHNVVAILDSEANAIYGSIA